MVTPLEHIKVYKRKVGDAQPTPHAVKSRLSRKVCSHRVRLIKTLVQREYGMRRMGVPDLLEWGKCTEKIACMLVGELMILLHKHGTK